MLRNKEVTVFLSLCMLLFISSILVASFTNIPSNILVGIVGGIYMFLCIVFTGRRYRHIKMLSEYVREISSGNYTLDLRDNEEGELSILKNEIYKVTSTLAEQGSALQNDKVHLMDSISDISHQLKTPLTSMTMMADFLSSPDLPEDKRNEFSNLLLKQLERIDWLVTSLLTLSKIDAGTVQFKKRQMLMQNLIDYVLESMQGIEENILVSGDEDTTIYCDQKWTAEALMNIMNNSLDYSPEGKKVQVTWHSNPLYTQIQIRDEGPGLSLTEQAQIFKRFFKGAHAKESGVGIGLAMAHSIITNQQGSIEVDSVLEEGTTFTITFYHEKRQT